MAPNPPTRKAEWLMLAFVASLLLSIMGYFGTRQIGQLDNVVTGLADVRSEVRSLGIRTEQLGELKLAVIDLLARFQAHESLPGHSVSMVQITDLLRRVTKLEDRAN